MRMKITNRSLAAWSGRMRSRAARVRPVAASTLNYVGEKVAAAMVRQVSAQTGMPEEVVRRHLVIRPASSSSLSYEIDASAAMTEATASRPMRGRRRREFEGRDDSFFEEGELVNIVDMGDERVCEVCIDAVEHGPYTIEEARSLVPLHPNCRCVVEPMERRRTAPVMFRQDGDFRSRAAEGGVREAMSELLGRMRGELRAALARAA